MIERTASKELIVLASQYKAVAVVGPRQSGKTTLVRHVFENKPYVSLENPDLRKFALEDPRGFLSGFPNGAIFDEVQRSPEIFSYLQQLLDESDCKGLFILTGSNNFLLQESISQSLAGRVGYLFLLPLSLEEIANPHLTTDELLFKGGYPALYNEQLDSAKYYANYVRTYVERDVRLLKNITNLNSFERFLRLCAGRVGQLLNMSNLSVEVGVDNKTISSWISVLEASFIIFRLQPFHQNYNKRIVKMPKLYFYDTGLAVSLLGVESIEQLRYHPFRGNLFENMIVMEFLKKRYNAGRSNNIYFWRDNVGNEVDLILDEQTPIPIEIKSGQTVTNEFFKGLRFWNHTTQHEGGYIVYGSDVYQTRSDGINIVPYNNISKIIFND
jgi:predicted AAA+ superfamily ATPase